MSQRYDELIAKLDLPAKVRLLTGASFFSFAGEEAIGLIPMAMSDGPTGVKGQSQSGGAPTSLLPNATLLASTWSEQTLTEVGEFLAGEAARHRTHIVLGPTINLHRSPLGGRVFESFSEDPLLTGRLAAAYVRGLQEHGVAACLKHLVGNEAETERHTVDVRIDETTLREVYLLPFEIAVADADAWLLMAAYNRVNGVPATEHDTVLNGIVKDEWGYSGLWSRTSSRPTPWRRRSSVAWTWCCPGRLGPGASNSSGRSSAARSPRRSSTTPCGACYGSRTGSTRSATSASGPRSRMRPTSPDGTRCCAGRRPG
jgi:hypothetical protein